MKRTGLTLIVGAIFFLFIAFIPQEEHEHHADDQQHQNMTEMMNYPAMAANGSLNNDRVVTGKDLYRLNCASCHGADRAGYPPKYPSLLNIKEKLSNEEIQEWIDNGNDRMPAYPNLTPQEKTAIIAFLRDEKSQSVEISTTGLRMPSRPTMGEMCKKMMGEYHRHGEMMHREKMSCRRQKR